MKFEDRDDNALDAALRELGDEARVIHSKSHLDAVYAATVASLDAQTKATKPGRVTVRASERDGSLLTDARAEDSQGADAHAVRDRRINALWIMSTLISAVLAGGAVLLVAIAGTDAGQSWWEKWDFWAGLPLYYIMVHRYIKSLLRDHLLPQDEPTQTRKGRKKKGPTG